MLCHFKVIADGETHRHIYTQTHRYRNRQTTSILQIVPEKMKLAKVIPIYKTKSRESFSNYRPISLLSSLSKVLENVVYRRFYSFLTREKVLYDRQYGLRHMTSTIDAIIDFTSRCTAFFG